MSALKKILAFIIVFGAIGAGIFIIGKNALSGRDKISLKEEKNPSALAQISNLAESESAIFNQKSETDKIKENSGAPPENSQKIELLENTEQPKNSTEALAKKLAQELIRKNPQGPSLLDGKSILSALDPEKITNEILAEGLEGFDYESLKTKVEKADLKTFNAISKSELENYFKNLDGFLENPLSGTHFSGEALTPQYFSELDRQLGKTISGLYALPVPSQLAGLHAEEISLLATLKNIYQALSNVERDPVKSFLVVRFIEQLENDFHELSSRFNKFLAENGL